MLGLPLERYGKLGIGESLSRTYHYPIACRELSSILRGAYPKLHKNLQSLIYQDTLTAFRLLPQIQTQTAVSAANLLVQSAEAVLPKQKKVVAVAGYKHAKIAHKRRSKEKKEEGSIQLPPDVLVHIFSFLDLQSLLSAASVCWTWNSAASDNYLWHLLHVIYFGDSSSHLEDREWQSGGIFDNEERTQLQNDASRGSINNWRDTFKKAYEGDSSKKLLSYRGYCGNCNAIVWLSNTKCPKQACELNSKNQQIKPVSSEQIVEYVLHGFRSIMFSSESEWDTCEDSSDSDGDWGFYYPRSSPWM